MIHFWIDHFQHRFVQRRLQVAQGADDRDVVRRYAMGGFPELLRGSVFRPAMLWYLDGRVNRKQKEGDKPNENYARELLELHTLGILPRELNLRKLLHEGGINRRGLHCDSRRTGKKKAFGST
jgi:uncharacterized protein (DUF1800 family)